MNNSVESIRILTNVSMWLCNGKSPTLKILFDILKQGFPQAVLASSTQWPNYYIVFFKDKDDAIMFKLKYGDYCQ
jgi:hypothetical protein